MQKLKKFSIQFLFICSALLSFTLSPQVFANESPYILMQQASDKLFGEIKANQDKIKQDPNYLKTIVKTTLMPYVHTKYAGSKVLGQFFRRTTPAERDEFFAAFSDFIEQSYAQALTLYTNQDIEIEKAKPITSNLLNIKVLVKQNSQANPIHLNFFWRKNSKSGEWQVYDMAAEGVSMLDTKKQEWSPILRKDGINALIIRVKEAAAAPITVEKNKK